MSDVVYCHSCSKDWFEDEWGLICPHCDNEVTEIVVVTDAPQWTEEVFSTAEDSTFLEDEFERRRPRSWFYGGHLMSEEERLSKEQTGAERSIKSDGQGENAPKEVVIAVMGVTGSGKSTFIRTMTGDDAVHVGHGLESDTSEVNSYRFRYGNIEFVLVDTPGFDDTNSDDTNRSVDSNCTDEKIMTRVLQWLESSYRSGMRLNGLIYLHRIIDPRMQGSSVSSMRMFRKLCGPECFGNIVLATTFWDGFPAELGIRREKELKDNDEFWGKMVKKGSEVRRLGTDKQSGMKLLMEIAKKNKITLQSQHEMVVENKSAEETAAAQTVQEEVRRQKEEFERKIEQQRIENEKELQRQNFERQKKLRAERLRAAERQEQIKKQEDLRREKQSKEWQAERERKQRELEEAKKEAEREKERLAAIEQRRKAAEKAHLKEKERLLAERKRHYETYSCQRVQVRTMYCDKCFANISNEHYYHCCFCDGDNYDQCDSCGGCCPVYEHPYMKRRFKSKPPDDDCIVM